MVVLTRALIFCVNDGVAPNLRIIEDAEICIARGGVHVFSYIRVSVARIHSRVMESNPSNPALELDLKPVRI